MILGKDKGDRIINLCEMKFPAEPYVIDKEYEMKLRTRMSIFKAVTKTRCAVQTTMITTFGVLKNKHYGVVDFEVILYDLFE